MACAKVIQTFQGLSASYDIIYNNDVIAHAQIPTNISAGEILYMVNGNVKYQIKRDLSESLKNITRNTNEKRLSLYKIFNEHHDNVGTMCNRRTKGFLKSYGYEDINFYSKNYTAYGIGLGKNGYKYPIYENDKQIALIEKENVVVDMKDIYYIYTLDEDTIELAILYCLRLDMVAFGNYGEHATKSKQVSYTITTNKELKNKYNPDFISRCI